MKGIGIDIGTTSICGVLVDVDTGKILKSYNKNSDAFLKGCAEWEKIQSVEKIIEIAKSILDELLDEDVAVIGVTGQMHGILYIDENGKAVSPLYTWQDERGNQPYKETTYAKHLGSFSGYGNVTDFYNRENGIRPTEAVSYCTIHDHFVMKICGLKKPIIHSSDAASFGLYDLIENKFNYDYDVDITSQYMIAGEYKDIPVSVAIGDNQASVLSTLANEESVLLNVGTGSQISIISDNVIENDDIEVRPYFENKYLIVGAALCGGRAYSVLKNFYSEILGFVEYVSDEEVYGIMNKMIEKSGNSKLTVDTRFAGTRKNANISGCISGITTENFKASELTVGVLEGMVNELFEMYKCMGKDKTGIVGSGNGIRKNPALVKIFEEKFGTKMKIPAHLEEAAFGAAIFGLISCGVFKNAKEACRLIRYS